MLILLVPGLLGIYAVLGAVYFYARQGRLPDVFPPLIFGLASFGGLLTGLLVFGQTGGPEILGPLILGSPLVGVLSLEVRQVLFPRRTSSIEVPGTGMSPEDR